MIYKLICLVLNLSVSTPTKERAFSSMNIIKNKLRNKMEDEFLDDLMLLHIEKDFDDRIDVFSVNHNNKGVRMSLPLVSKPRKKI